MYGWGLRVYISMNERNRKKQKERQETFRMLSLISQFGINMLVPIFLCFFLGMYIDKKLGTSYWIIIFFFIGAIAGFRNVYIFAVKNIKDSNSRQKELEALYQKGDSQDSGKESS